MMRLEATRELLTASARAGTLGRQRDTDTEIRDHSVTIGREVANGRSPENAENPGLPGVLRSALGGIRTPGRLIRSQVLYPD